MADDSDCCQSASAQIDCLAAAGKLIGQTQELVQVIVAGGQTHDGNAHGQREHARMVAAGDHGAALSDQRHQVRRVFDVGGISMTRGQRLRIGAVTS